MNPKKTKPSSENTPDEVLNLINMFKSNDPSNVALSTMYFAGARQEWLPILLYLQYKYELVNNEYAINYFNKIKQIDINLYSQSNVWSINNLKILKSVNRISLYLNGSWPWSFKDIDDYISTGVFVLNNVKHGDRLEHIFIGFELSGILKAFNRALPYKAQNITTDHLKPLVEKLSQFKNLKAVFVDSENFDTWKEATKENPLPLKIGSKEDVILKDKYFSDGKGNFYKVNFEFDVIKDIKNVTILTIPMKEILQMNEISKDEFHFQRNQYFRGETVQWMYDGKWFQTVDGRVKLDQPMGGFDDKGRPLFFHNGRVYSVEWEYSHGRVDLYYKGSLSKRTSLKNLKNFKQL